MLSFEVNTIRVIHRVVLDLLNIMVSMHSNAGSCRILVDNGLLPMTRPTSDYNCAPRVRRSLPRFHIRHAEDL